jgi:hypothetical protein
LILFLVFVVFGLEVLRLFMPDRHGRPLDAIEKAGGSLTGACLVRLIHVFRGENNQA